MYYGTFPENNKDNEKDEILDRSVIQIENLTFGMEPAFTSMMDIKIGTTNVTLKCQALGGADRKQKKEKNTTTPTHGFNMIGYALRDAISGQLVE